MDGYGYRLTGTLDLMAQHQQGITIFLLSKEIHPFIRVVPELMLPCLVVGDNHPSKRALATEVK